MKVLTIGGATLDTIIEYEEMETMEIQKPATTQSYLLLEEGAKIEVTKQKCFSGGGATNAAVSLKRLGFDVSFFGKIGRDNIGQSVLQELKDQDINTDEVRFSEHYGTATSYVVPSLKGDRTIFAYRGANRDLLTEDLPENAIKAADFVYVTSLSKTSAAQLPQIVKFAKEHDTKVAINPGNSQLEVGNGFIKESLHGIDILILNYEEAQKLMSSLLTDENQEKDVKNQQNLLETQPVFQDSFFSLKEFFQKTLSLGPSIVVVTDGSNGVYVGTEKELYFHPALKVENIVNTLGAGDAFGSSFCGGIYSGKSIAEAVAYGLVNSASVIQTHDAKSGLLDKSTLLKQVEKLDLSLKTVNW
ncbi:carbohydrate kinase family protein [Facilibium subflavum]|uniref:carbohydrate kinase family protein n=1 Tax=Facilibium subflavum TaxID=2219058 RepID=UPI000E64DA87|nr:carbohydrate kinase family protein [Facilibium subflavum]